MPSSITLTVSHLPTSTSFFLSALQPLDYAFRGRQEDTIGFGPISPPNTPPDFWITQEIPGVPAGAAHVAFPASSRAQVQDFFVAALKAGGKIHGEPCQRDASGYYSAAVIDFDGNSIEAVYRPGVRNDSNRGNEELETVVSRKAASVKAPSTVGPTKSVANAKATTVVSRAASKVPSQARSVTAPSRISGVETKAPAPTQPDPGPRGDVLDSLIKEARNAANVARGLVNSVRPDMNSSPGSADSPSAGAPAGGTGAGEAIVGTLLGVAAGAALHYAFSNRSKEGQDEPRAQPPRPSGLGRSITEPAAMGPIYSSVGSGPFFEASDGRVYRAIEPAPSVYSYQGQEHGDSPRLINMYDNDRPLALPAPRSDHSSAIRPPVRRRSIDSGFGPGPRDSSKDGQATSRVSNASRASKKSINILGTPPTSYRAPTVLTTVDTQASRANSRSGSAGESRNSRSRSGSVSRIMSRIGGSDHESRHDQPARSRSGSRVSHGSRKSRRDEFDEDEAQTVFHVTEQLHRTSSHQTATRSEHENAIAKAASKVVSNVASRVSAATSKHWQREPKDYPLPASRAATWAGSDGGSLVSARSRPGARPGKTMDGPKTIIGKLNPLRGDRGVQDRDFANQGSASVVSKQKDLAGLAVTDKEVRPEDSVSQISVSSRKSHGSRSKVSRR